MGSLPTTRPSGAWSNGLLSCCAYSACSVTMVLANKGLATYYTAAGLDSPDVALLIIQACIAVILVQSCKALKFVDFPDFDWDVARRLVPLNVFFVSMLFTSFLSLKYLHVPVVTVFKNLANILIVTGDYFLFHEKVTTLVVASFGIMTVGAVASAIHDIEFHLWGYLFMGMNCVFTACYVLFMRYLTSTSSLKLSRFSLVFYNNLLSIFLLLPLSCARGEMAIVQDLSIWTPSFVLLNITAGAAGFLLNLASLWCVGATSATTYAIVGSLNKIPGALLGFVLFNAKVTSQGAISYMVGMAGGFLYSYAKLQNTKR